jgi:hypothetical protein
MKKIPAIILSLLLIYSVLSDSVTASPLQWKKYKSIKYDLKNLPPGKTVAKYISPDKNYELISRKENNNLFHIYLHKKNIYTFIDDFQEIKQIEWSHDSSRVLFHGIKEIGQNEISYWKIRYLPAKNILLALILKINK